MRLAVIAAFSIAAASAALVVPAIAQERGGGMLDRLMEADTNKDGSITRAEMRTMREAHFRRMDVNNDGFISADERPQRADAAKAKGKGGERPGGAGMGGADANGDGKISRDEFLNAPTPGFDRLDANKNGVVEAAEIEAARAMMARRKQTTP